MWKKFNLIKFPWWYTYCYKNLEVSSDQKQMIIPNISVFHWVLVLIRTSLQYRFFFLYITKEFPTVEIYHSFTVKICILKISSPVFGFWVFKSVDARSLCFVKCFMGISNKGMNDRSVLVGSRSLVIVQIIIITINEIN